MTVTPALFVVGLIAWTLVVVVVNLRRAYSWPNILRITAGGLLVLIVLALCESTVRFFEAKVLLSAVGGGIMVRGFERERVRPEGGVG